MDVTLFLRAMSGHLQHRSFFSSSQFLVIYFLNVISHWFLYAYYGLPFKKNTALVLIRWKRILFYTEKISNISYIFPAER